MWIYHKQHLKKEMVASMWNKASWPHTYAVFVNWKPYLFTFWLIDNIEINYSGLRPGEKLYEELLNDNENTLPTHHPQIMRAKVQELDFEFISNDIDDLLLKFQLQNNTDIVAHMKMLVPEYKSNNSVFEELDDK